MARRGTSLGPKPSLFVFVVFVVLFFCCVNTKNLVFSPEKGIFVYFQCFSFFLIWPLLASLFFCFSFSVSLFSSFLSSFLSYLFAFFWFLVFVSFFLFFLFFLLCFSFMKGTTSKYEIASFVFINIFSFLVSCLFLFQVPFSYLCYFLILSYVLCSTSRLLNSTNNFKKWSKGGLQQNVFFFYQPVFWKMWKVMFFFVSLFGANFGWCSKTR